MFPSTEPREADPLPGAYRGIVEEVSDPEKRGRVRVRVYYVHPDQVETEHLPWAEVAGYGGRGFGDTPHYEVGDLVWVMFEGGDRLFPVLLGGWLSERSGIKDLPPEETQNYDNNRRRWIRHDRAGNTMEMSEADGKPFMRLSSGDTEVRLSKSDNSITIEAQGAVRVKTPKALVKTEQTFLASDDIIANANGRDPAGRPNGQVNIYSNHETRLYAADRVLIGQYIDDRGRAQQSGLQLSQAKEIALGRLDPRDGSKRTLNVQIEGFNAVSIASKGSIDARAPNITARADSQVQVYAGSKVQVTTPSMNISGSGNKLGGDTSSLISASLGRDISQTTGSGLSPKDLGSLQSPEAANLLKSGDFLGRSAGEVVDAVAGVSVPGNQVKGIMDKALNTDTSSIAPGVDIREVRMQKLLEGAGVL